jgi:hypothetical protein
LLVHPPELLDQEERQQVERLCQHAPDVQIAFPLPQEFIHMIRQRRPHPFDDWLARVERTDIPELQAFAAGLRRDQAAVAAALSFCPTATVSSQARSIVSNSSSAACTDEPALIFCADVSLLPRIFPFTKNADEPRNRVS